MFIRNVPQKVLSIHSSIVIKEPRAGKPNSRSVESIKIIMKSKSKEKEKVSICLFLETTSVDNNPLKNANVITNKNLTS